MAADSNSIDDENYMLKRNFLLRNYQVKLVEEAKTHNSIIYLPSGSGKTLIAIRVLCSRAQEINEAYSKNGKRAFFVAPTKVLVIQLAAVLLTHTNFQIGYYTGDMNLDSWSKEIWEKEFESNHVIVLTAEILRFILTLNYIHPRRISLIVFDECHNAVQNHPYCGIMTIIKRINESESPLILGLSATLIKKSNNPTSESLNNLENIFNAQIITDWELGEIIRYTASPKEEVVTYSTYHLPEFVKLALRMYEDAINALKLLPPSLYNSSESSFGKQYKTNTCIANRIKKCLVNGKKSLLNLGAFCGSTAALRYIILIEKFRLLSCDDFEIQLSIWARTELHKIRHILNGGIGEETFEKIYSFSTPKVQELIKIVKKNFKTESNFSGIVFVQEKVTALVLAFLVKRLHILDENFKYAKAEFVIGTTTCETFYKESIKNEEIIQRFFFKKLNLLFATNVLEEGIDVSACNAVISFDFPNGYSAYVQSRGRGRDKNSIYYIFCEVGNSQQEKQLNSYRSVEKKIFELAAGSQHTSSGHTEDTQKELWIELQCANSKNLKIDGSLAIQVVNRYCTFLPQDSFSNVFPFLWYNKNGALREAFLQLPIASALRQKIKGDPQTNIKLAKKSVYLKTLKLLHELKEIDDNLMIRKFDAADFAILFPHYKTDEINTDSKQMESKKQRQMIYKTSVAECFKNCLPLAGTKTYLHVINLKVAFDKPEISRKVTLYDLLQNQCTYGILTSKKLPKICQFPLFLDMGQIDCTFLVNFREIYLESEELYCIKLFHFALFHRVLDVVKNFKIYDNRNEEFSLFFVPLRKSDEDYCLNWEVIKSDFCKIQGSAVVSYNPSSQNARENIRERLQSDKAPKSNLCTSLVRMGFIDGRKMWAINEEEDQVHQNFIMTDAAYTNFVISPNYRTIGPPQYYVVSSFSYNMSPLSPFPREEYENFLTYYKDKYNVVIKNLEQPLLKVCNLPTCSNFNRPINRGGIHSRRFQKAVQYEELFVPELCNVYPFIRVYWIKALFLPTVINRISHIYRVDELRRTIARETGLGVVELPNNLFWKPLEVIHAYTNNENESNKLGSKLDLPLSQLKIKIENKSTKIFDFERNLNEIGLCDLENYLKLLCSTDPEEEFKEIKSLKNTNVVDYKSVQDSDIPKLKVLNTVGNDLGPELIQIVQACTSKSANDIIDYELLEIFGDSFLKFAVTVFLLKFYSLLTEGILSEIKGKLVGNRNLFYCALAKNLPKFINAHDFSPTSDWNPPLFCIPEELVNEMLAKNLDPAIISRFNIPEEEQFSGVLSEETLEKNKEILLKYGEETDFQASLLIRREALNNKTISDVVEALIGTYLLEFGLRGGFCILNWFDILPSESGSYVKLIKEPCCLEFPEPFSEKDVLNHLYEVSFLGLEEFLEYRFQNKGLLLEALTHPSYFKNRITLNYQRLEFLGDSVLDFLITTYIYENCQNLNPGVITDIRSALVNNITFACLSVRYGFHKYLLSMNSELLNVIEKFSKFQANRNHVVDENIMILLEEDNCLLAETVKAPKALGDVFESIAGAIFIDSGNSLETVWKIYYKLLKQEIDAFIKSVPKNAVRLLHEICGEKPYFESTSLGCNIAITCTVMYGGNEIIGCGVGKNYMEGKKSAAKAVLRKILELKS